MRPRAGGRADRARDRSRRGLPAQDQPHRSPEPGAPACCGTSGSGNDERQPFAFPFAGRTWTHFHANTNGNVSFAAPETTHWQQRDPWADGTMRSVAAAVDSRRGRQELSGGRFWRPRVPPACFAESRSCWGDPAEGIAHWLDVVAAGGCRWCWVRLPSVRVLPPRRSGREALRRIGRRSRQSTARRAATTGRTTPTG